MKPEPALKESPHFMALPAREKEALLYHLATHDRSQKSLSTVDLSQSLLRASKGYDGTTQTLCPNASTWLASQNRLLLGYEALAIQMCPVSWLSGCGNMYDNNALYLDLAGNAFTGSCYAAVMLAALATFPKPVQLQRDQDRRWEGG